MSDKLQWGIPLFDESKTNSCCDVTTLAYMVVSECSPRQTNCKLIYLVL